MGLEIERRFLVANETWKPLVRTSQELVQGYILNERDKSVRVRVANDQAWLTIKGGTDVLNRMEFEYSIDATEAREMIDSLCGGKVIEKVRHRFPAGGELTWEVDVFAGANLGLTIAEIELPSADTDFEKPDWLGTEISSDVRYLNSRLLKTPWISWAE